MTNLRLQPSAFSLQPSALSPHPSNLSPQTFKLQPSDFKLQTSNFRLQTSALIPPPLIFSLYKRKYREKLVISKYFVIFALKIFKSGKYGFDS